MRAFATSMIDSADLAAVYRALEDTGHVPVGLLLLRYYRARYYHTDFQRFIAEDPIGLAAGDVNFYVYVANNPLGFVDPLGLDKNGCPTGGDSLVTAANFSAGFGDIFTWGSG